MKSIFKITALLASFLVFATLTTGCAGSSLMQNDDNTKIVANETQASITFFRPSLIAFAFKVPIVKYSQENLDGEFIAHLTTGSRVTTLLKPGKYDFLIHGESEEILRADVEAGKNYYVSIDVGIGWIKPRFYGIVKTPKDLEDDFLKNNIKGYSNLKVSDVGYRWFESKKEELKNRYKGAVIDFDENHKSNERFILKKEYGLETPIH